jgi:thiol-disulfide isomerase/thioredoxin
LPGVDGKNYSLDDFASARVLVVVFTCNHCPTAQAYEDRIQQIARDYRDRGVALVAISPNDNEALRLDELGYSDLGDSFEDMKIRAKDKAFDFPYLYDGDTQEVSRKYGPRSTPHVFVFDADRKLRYSGRVDDSERESSVKSRDTRNAIDALLDGRPVPVETTPTVGCSVKWSDKRPSVKAAAERWAKEDVTLEPIDADGVKKLIANDSEKLRVINVWATFCGPCVFEFPELVTLHRMYRGREFELVTISCDPPAHHKKVLEFLKENQASTRNYHFSDEDTYKLVNAVGNGWTGPLPFTLIVAPEGKVIYTHEDAIDPLTVKKAIVGHLGRTYK